MSIWQRLVGNRHEVSENLEPLVERRETPGVRIQVQRLNKFFGDHHVLRNLDLTVDPGETFVIFGPSGCGKSVLLKLITGLLIPDSGRILVDGEDVHAEGRRRFRMAMVFQSSALFNSLSVGENVGLWLKEHRICGPEEIAKIVAEKLALVGLEGQQRAMPSWSVPELQASTHLMVCCRIYLSFNEARSGIIFDAQLRIGSCVIAWARARCSLVLCSGGRPSLPSPASLPATSISLR